MLSLPGYRTDEQLYESPNTRVFRAHKETDTSSVIIKLCQHENDPLQSSTRAQREFDLLTRCESAHIPQAVDCLPCDQGYALITDDCRSQSVEKLLAKAVLTQADKINIAIGIAQALSELHNRGIVHRDLRLANWLYNPQGKRARLIDLDAATCLSQEQTSADIACAAQPEYIAPEQTGRISRAVDYRSDFYAFGACLYHLFTGQPPFMADDLAGLLHAHIARQPQAAQQVCAEVGPIISAIITKLMAKSPDDRYQSTFGLLSDLQQAASANNNEAADFRAGQQDIAGQFCIPQKLYGREQALAQLLQNYAQSKTGNRAFTVVSGPAGIGKTALVEALRDRLVEDHGYFLGGKFDQLKGNEAYDGPIQVVTALAEQILSEDETSIAHWRAHINGLLGQSCAALAELIPQIKTIAGEPTTVEEQNSHNADSRFNHAVVALLQAVSRMGSPVVIFLDDLQWGDTPSLRCLDHILREPDLGHIHIIASYRSEEVDSEHPLRELLDALQKRDDAFSQLELEPLQQQDIELLLGDSLSCPRQDCAELAELLLQRTGGNPFFIRQMLTHLHAEGLFKFDVLAGRWRWSLTDIAEASYTQDVGRFMATQLQSLSPASQGLLQTAACIGSEFPLDLLAATSQLSQAEALQALLPALDKGLLSLAGIDSKLLLTGDSNSLQHLLEQHPVNLLFRHDTIAEAANQLLSDQDRAETHLRIAQLLQAEIGQTSDSQQLFRLATHFNQAQELLDGEQQLSVATINLKAAKAIQQTGGYEIALGLLEKALSLLPPNAWEAQYRLALELHQKAAELACLTADYQQMQALLEPVDQYAKSPLDKLAGYESRILADIAQNHPYQAVKNVIPMLAEFGLNLPSRPRPKHVAQGYLRTRLLLAGKSVEKLGQLPAMQDPTYKAGVQLLSRVVSAAYFTAPMMLPLIILLLVRTSVRHGLTALSPFGFVGFGALICGAGNKAQLGLKYGELGLKLAEQDNYQAFGNRAQFLFGHYIEHWNRPLLNTCDTLNAAFESSLRRGDQEFTAYPAALYCMHAWFAGKPLAGLSADMRHFGAAIQKSQHETAQRWHEIYATSVQLLCEANSNPLSLKTEHFDEENVKTLTPSSRDAGVGFHYRLNKLILCYLFADLEQADYYRRKAAIDLPYLVATPYIPVYHQFSALVHLARYQQQADAALLRKAHRSLRLMQRWAVNCPENFEHKAWLIEAEAARCHGHYQDAISAYEKAVDGAKKQAFHQDAAIALERAGECALHMGRETQGLYYLNEAAAAYEQWGAIRKVVDLQARHPSLQKATSSKAAYDLGSVDLASVIKSARALSGEIVLGKLVDRLMALVMENSGAERAVLLTYENQTLLREADCYADSDKASKQAGENPLAQTVLQYVSRTHEPVILKDAQREGQFRNDPYVRENGCRSLLCLPLLNQGQLSGLLYLENNLVSGAFNAARQEMLTVLCSQAAISLENARLYQNISQLNSAYERFVPHDMLKLLQRDSIVDVKLGDQIEGPMTALFTDIRGFTRLSENMTPEENFAFLNEYLGQMAPIIREHGGFINRYLGDALLAIFPGKADDAVQAAQTMLRQISQFNQHKQNQLDEPLRIGIGINTGPMMLGTVGEPDRMEGSILSDAVNVAARLENLTKTHNRPLIISSHTLDALEQADRFSTESLGTAAIRGRDKPVEIYAVLSGSNETSPELKPLDQSAVSS